MIRAIPILVLLFYISAQIFADIGSLRIVLLFGATVDAGTLIYPITFTLRDLIHRMHGVSVAYLTIAASAAINVLMAVYFYIVSVLPAPIDVPQADFASVLSPVWRIVFASIAAEIVSGICDTAIYELVVSKFQERRAWLRVVASNAVSVPIDSAVFVILAFAFVYDFQVLVMLFLSNVFIKYAISITAFPIIYLRADRVSE